MQQFYQKISRKFYRQLSISFGKIGILVGLSAYWALILVGTFLQFI